MVKFRARALEWLQSKTYLKSEIDTALNGKSDSNHAHSQYLTSHRTIDSSLSNSSTNAVQNKVITPALNEKVDQSDLLDLIYPIGSIYMSKKTGAVMDVCPIQGLLGGTWTRIENRFLYASEGGQGVGATGGEETHTLTVNEMPNHRHQIENQFSAGDGGSTSLYTKSGGKKTGFSPSTTYVGGGQAHNNMPPYIIVHVWERTA